MIGNTFRILTVFFLIRDMLPEGFRMKHCYAMRLYFHLYTKDNPLRGEEIYEGEMLPRQFDPKKETKLLIHDWSFSDFELMMRTLIDNYLETYDYNIIITDWREYVPVFSVLRKHRVNIAAIYLKNFLQFMIFSKLHLNNTHIIGYGDGAHIAGLACKSIKATCGRITGLDPTGNGYDGEASVYRLDMSDADFVDIIHTSAPDMGMVEQIGHVDFYPNEGYHPQPGCESALFQKKCSHQRSWKIFANSIMTHRNYASWGATSWESYVKGNFSNGEPITMGEHVNKTARGKYFTKTYSFEPFESRVGQKHALYNEIEEKLTKKNKKEVILPEYPALKLPFLNRSEKNIIEEEENYLKQNLSTNPSIPPDNEFPALMKDRETLRSGQLAHIPPMHYNILGRRRQPSNEPDSRRILDDAYEDDEDEYDDSDDVYNQSF